MTPRSPYGWEKRPYQPLDHSQPYRYKSEERVVFKRSEKPGAQEDSCYAWSRYAIYAFNIVSLVVGLLLLATGAWLRTDSRFRDFLSESYRQAVDEAFWEAPTLYTFSYILIVLGATMIVVAMIGCCGAMEGSRLFLGFYAFTVFVLLIFTLSCGIYVIYKKNGIDVELSDALNYMVQHYYQGPSIVQESLDRLQQAFRCCGNAGCSDFRIFRQDPPRTCDIRCDGCHYRIWVALSIGFSVAIAIFSIVVLGELVIIAVSLALVFRGGKRRPDEYPVYYYKNDYYANKSVQKNPAHRQYMSMDECYKSNQNPPYTISRYR